MSALTPEEKKRLAGKCEELALEWADGRGPPINNDMFWFSGSPACALAHVEERAGVRPYSLCWPEYIGLPTHAEAIDIAATNVTLELAAGIRSLERPAAAIVFPLLALRDALLEAP